MDRLKAETGSDPMPLDLDEDAREELPDTDAEPVPNTPPDPEDDLLRGDSLSGRPDSRGRQSVHRRLTLVPPSCEPYPQLVRIFGLRRS